MTCSRPQQTTPRTGIEPGTSRPGVQCATDCASPLHKACHCIWLGSELLVCCLVHRGSTVVFLLFVLLQNFSDFVRHQGSVRLGVCKTGLNNFILLIFRRRYFCCGSYCFMPLCCIFVLCSYVCFDILVYSVVLAYDMFSCISTSVF